MKHTFYSHVGMSVEKQDAQRKVVGNVCREAMQLLDYFALVIHDNWASQKHRDHWTYGTKTLIIDAKTRTHGSLKPFHTLSPELRERNRHVVMKILAELTDAGYSVELEKTTTS
jgi:hypothetical protein